MNHIEIISKVLSMNVKSVKNENLKYFFDQSE